MKRFLQSCLLAGTVLTAGAAEPALQLQGSGTQASPYLITSVADVVHLAEKCNSQTSSSNNGHYKGKYFKLTADIDMSSVTDFYGIATALLKNSTSTTVYYFSGNFDGDGHTIKNMKIKGQLWKDDGSINTSTSANGSRRYCGFFGVLKDGAVVKNLNIDASCEVECYEQAGGIAGYVDKNVTIENCTNAGKVRTYYEYSGGIVGYLYGSSTGYSYVKNCRNTGEVSTANQGAGGIVGRGQYCEITDCANTGDVLGYLFNPARTTVSKVAGIAGTLSYSNVLDCFNSGTVKCYGDYTAGILGEMSSINAAKGLGQVRRNLSLGEVWSTSLSSKGAILGTNGGTASSSAFTSSNYYDSQINYLLGACGGGNASGTIGLPTARLTSGEKIDSLSDNFVFQKGFYPQFRGCLNPDQAAAYILMETDVNNSNFRGSATISTAVSGLTAKMAEGKNYSVANGKVTLTNTKEFVRDTVELTAGTYTRRIPVQSIPEFFKGKGTQAEPYLISSKEDLKNLATMCNEAMMHYEDTYFRQTTDIDMEKDTTFHGIGGSPKVTNAYKVYYFSGNYDGGNFTIKNLKFDNQSFDENGRAMSRADNLHTYQYSGLFCTVTGEVTIKNIVLDETNYINGYSSTGSIVGYAGPGVRIENCHSAATVVGYYEYIGGIAGRLLDATCYMSNCSFSGNITAHQQYIGGITGDSKGLIENCANSGRIVANKVFNTNVSETSNYNRRYVGGIAGRNNDGVIRNCANYGYVAGVKEVGGIVGFSQNTASYKNTAEYNCLSVGTVDAIQTALAGAIVGDAKASGAGVTLKIMNAYYDRQLILYKSTDNTDIDTVATVKVNPMLTADLTSGETIDSLSDGFVFQKGFYPIPKPLAGIKNIKDAAATYIRLVGQQTIADVRANAEISTAMAGIKATLAGGNIFKVNGNVIEVGGSDEIVRDTLTLTNNLFTTYYTLQRLPSVLPGSGTKADPYQIKTAADYIRVADYLEEARYDFEGEYVALLNDIDFKGSGFKPIGTTEIAFNGTFLGNGHTLKNLKLEGDTVNFLRDMALFGKTGAKSTISDLVLDSINIRGYGYIAGLTTSAAGSIRNIRVRPTCAFEGIYHRTSSNNGDYVAGIAAKALSGAKFIRCTNEAGIKARKYAAGIVAEGDEGIAIDSCENKGDILAFSPHALNPGATEQGPVDAMAAGIVSTAGGNFSNLTNSGNVSAPTGSCVGGIVGQLKNSVLLKNLVNNGNVLAEGDHAGGIIGKTYFSYGATTTVDNAVNNGSVSGRADIGGIIGQSATKFTFVNSSNNGEISGTKEAVGGIVGYIYGRSDETVSMDKCYNTGKVSGLMLVAGLAGNISLNKTTITNSFNAGDVAQTGAVQENNSAAGIANGYAEVQNAYNTGNIKGWDFVGGIIGRSYGDVNIRNCYSNGQIAALDSADNKDKVNFGGIVAKTFSGTKVENCFSVTEQVMTGDLVTGITRSPISRFIERHATKLGDAFVCNTYCLPMLTAFDTLDVAKAYAAYFLLPKANNNGAIDGIIKLSQLKGVTWTADNLIEINGDEAKGKKLGDAHLTATCGKYSRTYIVKVDEFNGVEMITDADEIARVDYFTLDGRRISEPADGQITIAVYTTTSGKTKVRKIMKR